MTKLLNFAAKSFIIFFVIVTLPITYLCRFCTSFVDFLFQTLYDNFHQLWLMKILNGILKNILNSQKEQIINETPYLQFSSPRTKENNIKNILQQAAASPNQQTCNQKILLLREKMVRLEQRTVQESRMKRKVEQELFQINIKMIQKNAQICQQRNKNMKSLRQAEILEIQLANKQQQLQDLQQMIRLLEEELNALKFKTQQYQENLNRTIG